MDLFPIYQMYKNYQNEENTNETFSNYSWNWNFTFYFSFSFILALISIYISWSCNSVDNYSTIWKIIYAFFAFLFSPLYLLYAWFIGNFSGKCGLSGK